MRAELSVFEGLEEADCLETGRDLRRSPDFEVIWASASRAAIARSRFFLCFRNSESIPRRSKVDILPSSRCNYVSGDWEPDQSAASCSVFGTKKEGSQRAQFKPFIISSLMELQRPSVRRVPFQHASTYSALRNVRFIRRRPSNGCTPSFKGSTPW
jgi:hypothetical protein